MLKLIKESKQVGLLYHICSPDSVIYNLKNNSITPSTFGVVRNGVKYVSLTRNSHYVVDTINKAYPMFFQFVIDGDKLSENKKIYAYADKGYTNKKSENEEIVYGGINDLKKYLVKINIIIDRFMFGSFVGKRKIQLDLIDALIAIQNFNVNVNIDVVENIKTLKKSNTMIPTELSKLILFIDKIIDYDNDSVYKYVLKVCSKNFPNMVDSDGEDIVVFSKTGISINHVGDKIYRVIDIIHEYLNSSFVFTEQKEGGMLSKLSNHKLYSLLDDASYLFKKLKVNIELDAVYGTSPVIELIIQDTNGTFFKYFIYYRMV